MGLTQVSNAEEPKWEVQTMADTEEHGKLRFLDSFVGIFRRKTEPEESPQSFEDVRARFDMVLKDLEAKIETRRQEMEDSAAARGRSKVAGVTGVAGSLNRDRFF